MHLLYRQLSCVHIRHLNLPSTYKTHQTGIMESHTWVTRYYLMYIYYLFIHKKASAIFGMTFTPSLGVKSFESHAELVFRRLFCFGQAHDQYNLYHIILNILSYVYFP